MKKLVAILALFACPQGVLAAGADCRTIKNADERLACYDAAFVPRKDKSAPVETNASRAVYKDPLVAADAETAAKLKGICRGC